MIQLIATQITAGAAQNAQCQQHRSDLLWFFNPFVNFPKAVTLLAIPRQISLLFAPPDTKQADRQQPYSCCCCCLSPSTALPTSQQTTAGSQ